MVELLVLVPLHLDLVSYPPKSVGVPVDSHNVVCDDVSPIHSSALVTVHASLSGFFFGSQRCFFVFIVLQYATCKVLSFIMLPFSWNLTCNKDVFAQEKMTLWQESWFDKLKSPFSLRPRLLLGTEPLEDYIWEEIDSYDSSLSASIRECLSWHQQMLMDRDIYDRLFICSPRLSALKSELPVGLDPADWVIRLTPRPSDDSSLERIVDRLSYGDQDVLQSVGDLTERIGTIRLLSY
ncbi:hypothetical protein M5K25_021166 [Dendrobium thyrsiflorum]|uniref:Uncharacterized protein n=1 Tax=Dendrobium thyrsiflorum TaxID=117978 RepID=A0ABD0UBW2_DENTH